MSVASVALHTVVVFFALLALTFLYSLLRAPALLDSDNHKAIENQALIIQRFQKQTELSEKEIELLIAAYEGLPSFGNIQMSSSEQPPSYLIAGHIYFISADPIEASQYLEATLSLHTNGWTRRPNEFDVWLYQPTAKGFQKAKEIIESSEGKVLLANLRKKFPTPQ